MACCPCHCWSRLPDEGLIVRPQEAARDVDSMMAERHELQKQVGSGRKAQRKATKRLEAAEQEAAELRAELVDAAHKLSAMKSHEDGLDKQVCSSSVSISHAKLAAFQAAFLRIQLPFELRIHFLVLNSCPQWQLMPVKEGRGAHHHQTCSGTSSTGHASASKDGQCCAGCICAVACRAA